MTNEEFHKTLDRYLSGQSTVEDDRLLDAFYSDRLKKRKGLESWTQEERTLAKAKVHTNLARHVHQSKRFRPNIKRSWFRFAASLVFLLTTAIWTYSYISEESEVAVKMITKTTQRGQRATVKLSDGSVVKLNAESSITFPETFAFSSSRDVKLTGEAFFEVEKNPERPFIVTTGHLTTTVLGTSFNIDAYPEEKDILITVATGKVKVSGANQSEPNSSVFLVRSQQAIFSKSTKSLTKEEIDLEPLLAWKEGIILLKRVTVQEAAKILGRWYNASFVFECDEIKNCVINGEFRTDQLSNILENIKFLTGIKYEIKPGNQVILSGKPCKSNRPV